MADHSLSPADPVPPSPEPQPAEPVATAPGEAGGAGATQPSAETGNGAAGAAPGPRFTRPGFDEPPPPPDPGAGATPEPPEGRRRRSSRRRVAIEWLVVIAVTIALTLVIKTFVVEAFVIPSGSMEPTLKVGDRLLVDKVGYSLHRGDIVVFNKPPRDTEPGNTPHLVKRIVGLPGDTVSLRAGYVYIDGQRLNEHWLPKVDQGQTCAPYTGPSNCGSWQTTVPAGQYLVMGDNRADSYDSRYFGAIPSSLIVGKAFLLIWPLGSITFF